MGNREGRTRRGALLSLAASAVFARQDPDQEQDPRRPQLPPVPNPNEDQKLPNGKSQKDEIAKQNHEQSMKDAETLLSTAQELRDELRKAGNYVVPLESVKKTEEIEKLARRIRGRLKA
jgi:hypothetical protein